jgi:hypothetical protein
MLTRPPAIVPNTVKFKKVRPAHRPREEKQLRVLVGASVRAVTRRQLEQWTKAGRIEPGFYNGKYHVGRVLDELVGFGRRRGFRPAA